MKFNIKDIGSSGLKARQQLKDREVRSLLAEVGLELTEPRARASFELHLTRTDGGESSASTVFVQGSIQGELGVSCSRCLGPSLVTVNEERLRLTFLPAAGAGGIDAGQDPREQALSLDDLDTYTHDGESIDLRLLLREHLLLAIPVAPLCDPRCKGICSGCGAELNVEPCTCTARAEPASPWATALREIKERTKKAGG